MVPPMAKGLHDAEGNLMTAPAGTVLYRGSRSNASRHTGDSMSFFRKGLPGWSGGRWFRGPLSLRGPPHPHE